MLYAVAVEHEASLCPLAQTDPRSAQTLADSLENADLIGVFSMKAHRGVALTQADDMTALAKVVAQVLPNHKPPIIREVPTGSLLEMFYANPDWLEEQEDWKRYELLGLAAVVFPEMDFIRTVIEKLPTLSLRSLPKYLRDHAPA